MIDYFTILAFRESWWLDIERGSVDGKTDFAFSFGA